MLPTHALHVHIGHSLTALKCSNRIQLLSMHADMNGANLSCDIIGPVLVVPCQYQSVPITYMHMYKGIIYFTLYNIQSIVYSQRTIILSLRPYYHIWNCLYNNYYDTLHVSVVQPIYSSMLHGIISKFAWDSHFSQRQVSSLQPPVGPSGFESMLGSSYT